MIDMTILKRTPAYRNLWKSTHENIQFDSEKFLENVDENGVFAGLMMFSIIVMEILFCAMGYFNRVSQYIAGIVGYEILGIACSILAMVGIMVGVCAAFVIGVILFDKVVLSALIKVIMFVCIVKDSKYWNEQIDKYIKERTPELATEIDNFIKGVYEPRNNYYITHIRTTAKHSSY